MQNMQNYYIKKAKECELAIAQLQQRIDRLDAQDAVSLQVELLKVQREMENYKAAVAAALSEA